MSEEEVLCKNCGSAMVHVWQEGWRHRGGAGYIRNERTKGTRRCINPDPALTRKERRRIRHEATGRWD